MNAYMRPAKTTDRAERLMYVPCKHIPVVYGYLCGIYVSYGWLRTVPSVKGEKSRSIEFDPRNETFPPFVIAKE